MFKPIIALIAAPAVALGGATAASTAAATPSAAGQADSSRTQEAALTVPAARAGQAAKAAVDFGPPKGTGPESGEGTSGRETTLTDIRVGRHQTYDRVVFDFRGGVPRYHVEYGTVDEPGTGKPVPLAGSKSLEVTLHGVSRPYDRETLRPGLPNVAEVQFVGSFEGVATSGIGVSAQQREGFRVFTLSDPARLVIDVAHSTGG